MNRLQIAAKQALACLDLTNLQDGCTAADIDRLCADAMTAFGPVAAVCVWPEFVAQAKALLRGTPVRVATVVNFPGGRADVAQVVTQTEQAVADGADEIDLVIPWHEVVDGRAELVAPFVVRVREAAGSATLKAILESGMLETSGRVRQAAEQAVKGGADFLKTSTGKVPVNATPAAAQVIMEVIRAADRPVGFKPSGGVATTKDAAVYIAIAEGVMGQGWVTPTTFRIGSAGALGDYLSVLTGQAVRNLAVAQEGY